MTEDDKKWLEGVSVNPNHSEDADSAEVLTGLLRSLLAERMTDVCSELDCTKRALEIARQRLEQLNGVVACEGRPDGDTLLNGLQLASDMVACANPKYEMFEAYEAVEKWLKCYSEDTLLRIRKELGE